MMLYVGFKGKNNSSGMLAECVSTKHLLLTNSFDGLKRDIDSVSNEYDQVVMFGVDKTLTSAVRIEKAADKDGEKYVSYLDLDKLQKSLNMVGLRAVISEKPTAYLCNYAYWHLLRKFTGNVVLIHIPTIKHADKVFEEKMRSALSRYCET